jgi:hypothetical protein
LVNPLFSKGWGAGSYCESVLMTQEQDREWITP